MEDKKIVIKIDKAIIGLVDEIVNTLYIEYPRNISSTKHFPYQGDDTVSSVSHNITINQDNRRSHSFTIDANSETIHISYGEYDIRHDEGVTSRIRADSSMSKDPNNYEISIKDPKCIDKSVMFINESINKWNKLDIDTRTKYGTEIGIKIGSYRIDIKIDRDEIVKAELAKKKNK